MGHGRCGFSSAHTIAILGFFVLNQGAKFITDNAVFVSRRLGISRFVIGCSSSRPWQRCRRWLCPFSP